MFAGGGAVPGPGPGAMGIGGAGRNSPLFDTRSLEEYLPDLYRSNPGMGQQQGGGEQEGLEPTSPVGGMGEDTPIRDLDTLTGDDEITLAGDDEPTDRPAPTNSTTDQIVSLVGGLSPNMQAWVLNMITSVLRGEGIPWSADRRHPDSSTETQVYVYGAVRPADSGATATSPGPAADNRAPAGCPDAVRSWHPDAAPALFSGPDAVCRPVPTSPAHKAGSHGQQEDRSAKYKQSSETHHGRSRA